MSGQPEHYSGPEVPEPEEMCEFEGHIWEPMGGGLFICMRCENEEWDVKPEEAGS